MAKRAIILMVAFLLLATPLCFAQIPRAGQSPTPTGQTTFGSIELTGLDDSSQEGETVGAPGYICLMGADGSTRYYIWVGTDGDIRIASGQAVGLSASPTMTTWRDASGPLVGLQAR